MYSAIRRRRRGTASATGVLVALTIFGVLLMHSVTPMTSVTSMTSMPMSMSVSPIHDSVPVMFGEHDCPSAHQMMHPCVGTPASWPALTVPALATEIDLSPTSMNCILGRTDSALERAPPWTLWELDRSVTLRV